MERLLTDKLLKWKEKKNRKPLLLKGARQVGKTWIMKSFGKKNFENVAYVNFDNNKRMRDIFNDDYNIDRIITAINIETGQKIIPDKTLIIFDEVQEVPRAISSLKYFYENAPKYAIIAAGSLLGVAIHKGVSIPVGKIDILHLEPMNYREFLMAMGETDLANLIETKDYDMMASFSTKYIDWLKKYYYIGGMPEVVKDFAENKDFNTVKEIQNIILEQYEDDFGKHADASELSRIRMVWNSIPMQLAKENKKFFFGHIKKGARAKDFEEAIEWLLDCGLINKVYRVNKPAMPLKSYTEFSAFKIYLLDVGLLTALSDLDALSILEGNSIFTEFKGSLTEQYVSQQLMSDTTYTPYYFSPSEHNEIDFIIQKGKHIVPIEVKAENNLKSKSLKAYCDKFKPEYAVRTSMANYEEQSWMTNLPLYAIHNL